ncbi:hypothetical protein DFH11DRAFT_1512845 [Phellopilus nigrolimitatus]|nr:hypothetical protein DFH11DRAFT_1512845 [Phellopilus nigrolimitatus]
MSTASGPAAGPASFELLVGPLLIGVVVNAFVFGICIMQLVEYFLGRHRDSWKLVALLAWVFSIDVFQVASSVAMLWHYVVANFTNPAALASGPWEYATLPIFNALTTLPIQHFMAWRIMRFARSRTLFAFLSALSLAQAALGCAAAAGGLRSTALAAHVAIVPLADAWLAASVACDMSITVLLMYYLNKSRTGFERTDSVISRICRVTVEAAVPVTFLCLLDLIFLTTTPNNNLHYMFALPVGRLYTNTLLSTLNERESLRRSLEGDNSTPSRQGQGQGISLGVRPPPFSLLKKKRKKEKN